jgi:two-component sensor histidine kinase
VLAPIIATAGHTLVMMQLHHYSSYHAEIYLIIFWVFTVSGLPMRHAIFTTLVMISISALGAFYTDGVQLNDAIMHLFWMISSFTFGLAGAYLLESSNRTVFSQHTELHQELSNKSILLKELAHRVKNNLQIVSSILYSHSKKVTDTQTKEIFDNSIQTIKAMGMIHEKLFQSSNLEAIDFKEYIKNLINLVSQNIRHKKVRFSFDSKTIMISIDNAIPLGLVVNEILTNSLKYAIVKDNEDILIRVAIMLDDEQKIHLHISDNGGGIDFAKRKEGFGTQLINSLIRYQLKGEVDCFNSNGLHYDITFTDTDK